MRRRTGGRDALFDGERVGDRHIVRGGPVQRLTLDELRGGRFVSTNEDLVPLQTLLRTRIKLFAQLGDLGDLSPISGPVDHLRGFAQSEALSVYSPRTRTAPPAPASLSAPFADHLADSFRREYKLLCEDDVLGSVFPQRGPPSNPCDPLDPHLTGLGALLEQLTLTSVPSRTAVSWQLPSDRYNALRSFSHDADGDEIPFILPQATDPPGTCFRCSSGFICPPGGVTGDACVFEASRTCTRDADCVIFESGLFGVADDWGYGVCRTSPHVSGRCDFGTPEIITFDHSPTAPVLSGLLSFDADTDVNNIFAPLVFSVRVTRADLELRVQPLPCARAGEEGACTDRIGVAFEGGHGPSASTDLVRPDIGLDLAVRGRSGRVDVGFTPGVLCVLLTPLACVIAHGIAVAEVRASARKAMIRGAKNLSASLEQAIEIPSLARAPGPTALNAATVRSLCNARQSVGVCNGLDPPDDDDDDDDPATLDTFAAFAANLSLDLGTADVRLNATDSMPSEVVALGAPGGAFSNRTIDALFRGGEIVRVTSDLSPLQDVCGATHSATNPEFVTNCGPEVVVPHPACRACVICQVLAVEAGALCRFDGPQTTEVDDVDTGSFFTIPPSPTVAAVFDGALTAGIEIRELFAQPLTEAAAATGASYRYSSAETCAALPRFCPPGAAGAVFGINQDLDRDGVRDAIDNCEGVPNPVQENADGDAFGDACDGCPCHVSNSAADFDHDGTPDACDDNADGDACSNNWLAPVDTPRCLLAPPLITGEVYDQLPRGTEVGPETGLPLNTDGLGSINDCDEDDDGDGVLDDCRPPRTTRIPNPAPPPEFIDVTEDPPVCFDNCRLIVNPDQADENDDLVGDACEFLLSSGPSGSDDGRFIPVPEFFASGAIPRNCLRDGPGCWGFAVFDCGTANGCGSYFDRLKVVSPSGALLRTMTGARFTGASIAVPDLDGDRIDDLIAVVDEAKLCNPQQGQDCVPFGSLVTLRAIGSGSGATLWTYVLPTASLEAGRSNLQLATVGRVVAIGDPKAIDLLGEVTGGVTFIELDASAPRILRVTYATDLGALLGTTVSAVEGGFIGGAPGAGSGAGALELFEASGRRIQRITGTTGLGLGSGPVRVAVQPQIRVRGQLQGDLLVTGNPAGSNGASVSVFRWDGTLVATYAVTGTDALGTAISDPVGQGNELLVGAPTTNNGAGAIYVLDVLAGTLARSFTGSGSDGLGSAVDTVGDATGDGIAEIAIGRPGRLRLDGGFGLTMLVIDTAGVFHGEPL